MSWLLCVDTAGETAFVTLAHADTVVMQARNEESKNHAAFIQPAIAQLVKEAGISLWQLAAVAVTIGPGSYTGIRVGMASAKGLCYALDKPFIGMNGLQLLAHCYMEQNPSTPANLLICPMIDARRMEVFTALYDTNLVEKMAPTAEILQPDSFTAAVKGNPVVYLGSGMEKWKAIHTGQTAQYSPVIVSAAGLSSFAYRNFTQKNFQPVAYTPPLYVKNAQTGMNKQN